MGRGKVRFMRLQTLYASCGYWLCPAFSSGIIVNVRTMELRKLLMPQFRMNKV